MKSEIRYNKEFCEDFVHNLQQKVKDKLSLNTLDDIKFNEINFEKDTKNKNQFNFIYSCTNLRAYNFQIPQNDFIKIKNLSSNIIPSIVTSNAVITGLVTMQLYLLATLMVEKEKYNNSLLETKDALRLFRNYNIDLGKNNFYFYYLPEKIIIETNKDIPIGNFTVWDSIFIKGPLSMKEFLMLFKEKYKVNISSVYSGKSKIFNNNPDEKESCEQVVEDLYKKVKGLSDLRHKRYLILELYAKTFDEQEVIVPRIKYLLKFQ